MRHLAKNKVRFNRTKYIWLLILLGSLTWSLTMVKSGWSYSYGAGFWGANGHDGVWHIALINSLAQGSLENPVFAGEQLKNYHLGFDYFLALIKRISGIPAHTLYFQIIPPLIALGIGFLTYKFVMEWRKSYPEALFATFFVYFAGSWGWLVNLFRGEDLGGESMFWSQQAISTLINPPYALSLVFLLLGLWSLLVYERKKNWLFFLISVISFALLLQIKVYAGILGLSALGLVSIFKIIDKKDFSFLLIFVISSIFSLFLFSSMNKVSTGLLVYQPFWFLETMMAISDRVGWPRYHEAMINYRLGNVWYKMVPAYLIAFLIFWFGNMGTRAIKELAVWNWFRNIKRIGWIEVFIATIIITGGLIPMLFLQKGTPWNTIQFFYYSLFFSAILAGIAVRGIKNSKLLICIVVLLTLPTTIITLYNDYLPSRPPAKLSTQEFEALKFLSGLERGVVITYPYNSKAAHGAINNPPRPLYLYESTAYVSAFSQKPVFLEDEVNLTIMDYDWKQRRLKIEEWLVTQNQDFAYSFLRDNNISYIYWVKGQRAVLGESQLGVERIFENKEVDIYRTCFKTNASSQDRTC